MPYCINQISDDVVQVYGIINGFFMKEVGNQYFTYKVKLFNKKGQLITISNGNNKTVTNINAIRKKIAQIYKNELQN